MTSKIHRLLGLFALFLIAAGLRAQPPADATPAPDINIHSPPAVTELAAGYATAVAQMTTKLVTIHYVEDRKQVAVRGISAVRAHGGVLLITLSAGDKLALPADSVTKITDSPQRTWAQIPSLND